MKLGVIYVLEKDNAIDVEAPDLKRPLRSATSTAAKRICGLDSTVPTVDLMPSGCSDGVYVFRFVNDSNTLCWLNSVIGVTFVM
jgi:hypothetical protein